MKAEDKEKEINWDDIAITLEVDADVIKRVRSGDITHIITDINDKNQSAILECDEDNLILSVEPPTEYYGCYFYNNGEFPYLIKDELQFLILGNKEDHILATIIDYEFESGTRFRMPEEGKPLKIDPNGECCLWKIGFEIVPVIDNPRTYLMRWNPAISSFTEQNFKECMNNEQVNDFRLDWSIHEWEEARRGDFFYLMRVGDDKAGVVAKGLIISDPYVGDDWAGSSKRRHYVDLHCKGCIKENDMPAISLETLQKAIPEIEWGKGHSGVLLSEEVTDKLDKLWEDK